jgi:hypothetical protein
MANTPKKKTTSNTAVEIEAIPATDGDLPVVSSIGIGRTDKGAYYAFKQVTQGTKVLKVEMLTKAVKRMEAENAARVAFVRTFMGRDLE